VDQLRIAFEYVLGTSRDVDGVIADPLEIPDREEDLFHVRQGFLALDASGPVIEKRSDQGLARSLAPLVEVVVPVGDGAAGRRLPAPIGTQRVFDHLDRQLPDFDDPGFWQAPGASPRVLGEVRGEVADPLEVREDLERARDESEVAGHRLFEREEVDTPRFEFEVPAIDGRLARFDRLRQRLVLAEKRLQSRLELVENEFAHVDDGRSQLLEGRLEGLACHGHPNLPVMYSWTRWLRGFSKIWSVSPYSTSSPPVRKTAV
jgi:hypothetical protein